MSNPEEAAALLRDFSILTVDGVEEYLSSKQSGKIGRDIAAATEVRLLKFLREGDEVEVIGFVHSTHTKKVYYRNSFTATSDAITSWSCVCLGRYPC